ncbi:MAG TPA: ATP-binding cassette domain-containing protein [Galbitalea sp.]|jgi:ABC-type sugar transport system ATPase subunit|nr:ATP-binding cassette domain-containing protein [Galbitalea sp.]
MIEARALSKSYGAVTALSNVSFGANSGEVIAIVGDNGAGKSTLLKVLSGAIRHDAGDLLIDGQLADFRSPRDAERAGVETVYQDLALINTLEVASNIYLGRERRRRGILGKIGFVDHGAMRREGREALRTYLGVDFPNMVRTVEMLSGGQRQAVAIARAATRLQASGPGAILLDEPTAALGVAQRRRVDDLVERLAQSGHLVVVVSHDLPAVFQFAHRILVMRLGRLVTEVRPADSDLQTLVGLITGAIDPAEAAPTPEEAR